MRHEMLYVSPPPPMAIVMQCRHDATAFQAGKVYLNGPLALVNPNKIFGHCNTDPRTITQKTTNKNQAANG